MKRYLVYDCETSGQKTHKRFCNPIDSSNEITLAGWKKSGQDYKGLYRYDGLNKAKILSVMDLSDVDVIVGHNLKFDLLWLWGEPALKQWIKNGGMLWDTLTVQYLLDAQRKTGRSLDDVALKYGGTLKDPIMKDHYKSGGTSKSADRDVLVEYNKEDVNNTLLIFKKQVELAKKEGMMEIIKVYMGHYRAIIEMEYNGLYVKESLLKEKQEELQTQKEKLSKVCEEYAATHYFKGFNPSSNDHLSLFLFGGSKKVREKRPCFDEQGLPIFVKKTGLQKERLQDVEISYSGILDSRIANSLEKNKKGNYFVDVDILSDICTQLEDEKHKEFLNNLLEYRKICKLLDTYCIGLLECYFPQTRCVHPEFKTSSTFTGRLSCTNPNAQNLHPSVLDVFTSRYGDSGFLVEIDCSQLEIRLQAYLSDCEQMLEDIRDNVDFHTLRMSYAEEIEYEQAKKLVDQDHEWAMKRKKIGKPISFGKAYGASPQRISLTSGLPVEVVEQVFKEEDKRYPEIEKFYKEIHKSLEMKRRVTLESQDIKDKTTGIYKTVPGEQKGYSVYKSITGKKYHFDERAVFTKFGSVFRYFYMPEIQDYPIQGLAGDYVALQVSRFYDWLIRTDYKCRLVDEIHDSILLDIHAKDLTNVVSHAKLILEDVKEFERITNKKFKIKMPVDVKIGKTWKEIKEQE